MPVVLGGMYTASLAAMVVYVVATGAPAPSGESAGYALAAGLCGIAGLGAFYRGLAIGTMSIVAPISATGVALPVVVGLLRGDEPGPVASAGLVLAVVGVVLASRETAPEDAPPLREDARRQSIILALVAALGFGAYFTLADLASEESVEWALLLSRVVSTPVLLAIVVVSVGLSAIPRAPLTLVQLAGIGMLDLLANASYNVATTKGELSGVAVAAALYPVVTVLLAAVFLHERVRGSQAAGVVAALGGVVMIAAG